MSDRTNPSFECESLRVAELLDEIASVGSGLGAWFAPGLVIRERGGVLSGHLPAGAEASSDAGPLIVIPDVALPRVNPGVWGFTRGRLEVEVDPEADQATRELLPLFAELFTATEKPAWYSHDHPRGALMESHATTTAIRRLRPTFQLDPSPMGFLETRVYAAGPKREPCLLPIADALNHHHAGAPIRFSAGSVRIAQRRPLRDSECYVAYGGFRRDPLDIALAYGFADREGHVARSAAVQVVVPRLGIVRVGMPGGRPTSVMDPPTAVRTADGLDLSHLTYQAGSAQRTVVPLHMLLQSMGIEDAAATTRVLLDDVATANIALIDQLVQTLDPGCTVGAMLLEACEMQSGLFSGFVAGLQ